MKNHYVTVVVILLILTLVFVFGSLAIAQGGSDSQPQATQTTSPDSGSVNTIPGGDDSNPIGLPTVVIPPQYQPQTSRSAAATTAATTTDVYFTPQDENTSTTVLFLYNTGATGVNVPLKTYNINGGLVISITIGVPARSLVRIVGDDISTVAPSWAGAMVVNFTTHSAYAVMTIPASVKAEGYVAWNNSDNYDPLQPAPVLPLRFSSDPLTIFLPSLPGD